MTVARTTSEHLQPLRPVKRRTSPGLLLIYGFLALIAIGTALLMLPISSQDRSRPRRSTPCSRPRPPCA
ncbi:MAG: hypothetical protein R3C32_04890 [Chloroflexota bacterium]